MPAKLDYRPDQTVNMKKMIKKTFLWIKTTKQIKQTIYLVVVHAWSTFGLKGNIMNSFSGSYIYFAVRRQEAMGETHGFFNFKTFDMYESR